MQSTMRDRRKSTAHLRSRRATSHPSIVALVLALLVAPVVLASGATALAKRGPTLAYRAFAPRWSTEAGSSTTLYVRNVQAEGAVRIRLSLMLDHRTLTLPPTEVAPLQTLSVDVAALLRQRGEKAEQGGAARIDFQAASAGGINAYVHVLDTVRGSSFSFPFQQSTSTNPGPLEAVTWAYGANTDTYVALQNTTRRVITVSLTLVVAGRTIGAGARQLQPREATTLSLDMLKTSSGSDAPRSAGVRLESSGRAGSLVAQGWVVDERIGFSAPFAFHATAAGCCPDGVQHLYGTGVAIGPGAMGMAGAVFSPYLAVRNASASDVTVTPTFSYATDDGVAQSPLPQTVLGSQECALINLRDYQRNGSIPAWVVDGNIDVQYQGPTGALVAEMASVDQDGAFVSPVPLSCNGNRALHMPFWRTDGDWHSMVALQNIADTYNDVEITISYPDGIYVLHERLGPAETRTFSIDELQRSQEPDELGRAIPLDAVTGGVNVWSTSTNAGLVMNAMLMNPVTKTCGSCNGTGYVTTTFVVDNNASNGASALKPHLVSENVFVRMELRWSTSTYSQDYPSVVSSLAPSIAELQPSNAFLCKAPGSAQIDTTTSQYYPTDIACSYYHQLPGHGQLNVYRIKILQDGTDVTGQTRTVVVGQKINLSMSLEPAGTTASKTWTIPGNPIAGWTASNAVNPATASVTALTGLTNPTISYYWCYGPAATRVVEMKVTVNGNNLKTTTTFDVRAPSATIAITKGPIAVDVCNGLELHYGCYPGTPGIKMVPTLTEPTGFTNGTVSWAQTWSVLQRRQPALTSIYQRAQVSGCDNQWPIPPAAGDKHLEDSPGAQLGPAYSWWSINDSYGAWLMWKPNLPNAIYVPVRTVTWSWSASATNISNNNWFLNGNPAPTNPATDAAATSYPTWTRIVTPAVVANSWANE